MPLEFGPDEVRLSGNSVAEEALELSEWLATHPNPKVGLAACTAMHTSLLQTILAYRPVISAPPQDPFLARWVVPLLRAACDAG